MCSGGPVYNSPAGAATRPALHRPVARRAGAARRGLRGEANKGAFFKANARQCSHAGALTQLSRRANAVIQAR